MMRMNEYKLKIKLLAKDQLTESDFKTFYSKLLKVRSINGINRLVIDFSINEKLF